MCRELHGRRSPGSPSLLTNTLEVGYVSAFLVGSLPNCSAALCTVDNILSGMSHYCDGVTFLESWHGGTSMNMHFSCTLQGPSWHRKPGASRLHYHRLHQRLIPRRPFLGVPQVHGNNPHTSSDIHPCSGDPYSSFLLSITAPKSLSVAKKTPHPTKACKLHCLHSRQ